MVMVTGAAARRASARHSREGGGDGDGGGVGGGAALHERLVAYVHAIDAANDARSSVWGEHSYARARAGAAGGAVRVLLAPRPAAAPPGALDVERLDAAPPAPPDPDLTDPPFGSDSDAASDEDEWEERVVAGAPGGPHARLAAAALEALRRVRLARLAGGRLAERVTLAAEATRLRLALAPLWARGGPPHLRPPQWLHAALTGGAPPAARRTYERLLTELRRAAPRLAERLAGPRPSRPAPSPTRAPAAAEPWLVWVGGGRWGGVLGALLPTRVVGAEAPTAAPDAWCAAVAGSVRAAFADILAEAGSRGVVVGGAGGCAALAAALAGGGGARAALLLGPALLTAEGAREPGGAGGAPALLVVGGRGACGPRALAAGALGAGGARVLVVAGADDQLRLPAAALRRKRLTQDALDAAVAEECVRWALEAARAPDAADAPDFIDIGAESSEDEFSHLPVASYRPHSPPPATLAALATPLTSGNQRAIEIVEGRVVSRGAGGTPLALLPPRRLHSPAPTPAPSPATTPTPALAAADIMHLPIVFADDEPEPAPAPPPAPEVTVTSGAGAGAGASGPYKYTRVIVAKRAGGARPLLLRRPPRAARRPHTRRGRDRDRDRDRDWREGDGSD